ncbi:hypothetical protein BKM25_24885 [Pseudomonas avellanae]|nr:hypothetical protein BKM25_24885 [Pseudomonas avellanae]
MRVGVQFWALCVPRLHDQLNLNAARLKYPSQPKNFRQRSHRIKLPSDRLSTDFSPLVIIAISSDALIIDSFDR